MVVHNAFGLIWYDDEAQRLISRYNGELLKKLRMNAIVLPGGGAIGVSSRF